MPWQAWVGLALVAAGLVLVGWALCRMSRRADEIVSFDANQAKLGGEP